MDIISHSPSMMLCPKDFTTNPIWPVTFAPYGHNIIVVWLVSYNIIGLDIQGLTLRSRIDSLSFIMTQFLLFRYYLFWAYYILMTLKRVNLIKRSSLHIQCQNFLQSMWNIIIYFKDIMQPKSMRWLWGIMQPKNRRGYNYHEFFTMVEFSSVLAYLCQCCVFRLSTALSYSHVSCVMSSQTACKAF